MGGVGWEREERKEKKDKKEEGRKRRGKVGEKKEGWIFKCDFRKKSLNKEKQILSRENCEKFIKVRYKSDKDSNPEKRSQAKHPQTHFLSERKGNRNFQQVNQMAPVKEDRESHIHGKSSALISLKTSWDVVRL